MTHHPAAAPESQAVIYSAEPDLCSFTRVVRDMAHGVPSGRFLAWRLFRRDLKTEFTSSLFGYLWTFADPLILAGVFIVLKGGGLISIEAIGMPYALYVLFGMSLLQIFIQSIRAPLRMIPKSQSLLSNVRIPPESLLMASVLRQLFDAVCYIPILAIVSIWLGAFHIGGFLLFMSLLPLMVLLGYSLGLAMTPLNAIYDDCEKFIANISRPLIFICPTFYRPAGGLEWLETFNAWNPIGILMNNLRQVAVQGTWFSPISMAIVGIASIILLLIGWLLFHVSIRLVTDPV